MSQKNEKNPGEKWRELEEVGDVAAQSAEKLADDTHLLEDESNAKTLHDKVVVLEKQNDVLKDQVARGRAEIENLHRRMEQEVTKARKFGVERVISELIPIADSLFRGLEGNVSGDASVQSMRKGMELTLDMLHKLLEKNGVTSIDPKVGDAFDPSQHEAMSMRPDPDAKHNTILQVLQKGYALHGRVIRAAMVIVSQ